MRVAVIGGGVSGLVAAHVLAKSADVTLFEADDRLGGHADTHEVDGLAIDTGFIVHNERTYPTLLRLFDELGVATQESDMSMSVRDQATGLEYAGARGVRGLFPRGRNLRNARYLRMLVEISRFHRRARRLLASPGDDLTLEAFLEQGRFSAYFRRHFVTPLVACVWSCDPDVALDYPARYLFTFLEHHGMLTVFGSPTWRTVTGGSREYVDRVAAGLTDVRLGTKVTDILETADCVRIVDGSGASSVFDKVVVAVHPDQALAMLGAPTTAQRETLGTFRYSENLVQLHTDASLLPTSASARASWNYQRRADGNGRVLVTYDLTRLMRLDQLGGRVSPRDEATYRDHDVRYLVTLNGADDVDPATVIATREYAHPIYDPRSVAAQQRLEEINTDRLAFAGAWLGWGFHEDGALSGLRAAEHLGGNWPGRATLEPRAFATTIRHLRAAPVRNRFTYRSTTWLVDLDRLPGKGFEARDHIGDPDLSIRLNIEDVLADDGIDLRGGRILMLANRRSLGYVFNPISVFWCYSATGDLAATVVEVHNTYGGRHAYLVHPDATGHAEVDKVLYVSPFNDTSGRYRLRVPEPTDRVHLSVTLERPGLPPFVATLSGRETTARRWSLAPHLVMARIRLQGVRLWLRRLPVQPRPAGDER